jgi:hypothetical protein
VKIRKVVEAVGIGLVDEFCLLETMPGLFDLARINTGGWDENTLGIHSDDGQLFIEGVGKPGFCIPFNREGQIFGIGYCQRSKKVFFTLNGAFVSEVTTLSPTTAPNLYPAVGFSDKEHKGHSED